MRPLRQINFVVGLLLLIGGGAFLMYGLSNMTAGLRKGGFDAALHAPNGAVDAGLGLASAVVGLALLRSPLRRRLPRIFVVSLAVLVVLLGVHAGYVR
ncbi:MAG: hypothetical protein JSR24_13020 [Proteobacteria bacterium]|nr:hypothetical protein [Pseudomonadota bacterium]